MIKHRSERTLSVVREPKVQLWAIPPSAMLGEAFDPDTTSVSLSIDAWHWDLFEFLIMLAEHENTTKRRNRNWADVSCLDDRHYFSPQLALSFAKLNN